ncbi:hypothetical protein E2C01_006605 [Portunus trituberculatus]|uniref:Uncharacterized protein n=1 Tax=Portunus trituberculatus TaxID=210409 RepID=A0A5B7CVJ7_PORTR|nr:hypothetical protein [Portunus trituberculatus]
MLSECTIAPLSFMSSITKSPEAKATTNIYQNYAIWSQCQCCVVVSGFNGQCVGTVVAKIIHRDLIANRTYDSVAIMGEYYVS